MQQSADWYPDREKRHHQVAGIVPLPSRGSQKGDLMGEVLKPNCGYDAHSGRQHGQGDAQSAARRSRQGVGHADIVVPAFTWLPLVVDKRTTWQHPRRTPGAARIRFVAQRGSSPSPQRWRRHRAEHGSSAPANRAPPSVADSWTALMPLRCRRLHSWYISLAVRDWAIRSAVCSSGSQARHAPRADIGVRGQGAAVLDAGRLGLVPAAPVRHLERLEAGVLPQPRQAPGEGRAGGLRGRERGGGRHEVAALGCASVRCCSRCAGRPVPTRTGTPRRTA